MKRASRLAVGASLLLAFAPACSGSAASSGKDPKPDAGADAGIDAGIDAGAFALGLQAATASQPLYSISYDEQGPFIRALFIGTDGQQVSCPGLSQLPGDSWILDIWVPNAPGTYEVGPSNSDGFPPISGGAVAALLRSPTNPQYGPIEILPTEGQVILTSVPAGVSAQTGGAHLTGSFHLGYPADPLQPPRFCNYGVRDLPDGGTVNVIGTCACDDWGGNEVSVCDGGGPDCCLSTDPAEIFADEAFDALPCAAVCVAPTGNYAECLPLVDGGVDGG